MRSEEASIRHGIQSIRDSLGGGRFLGDTIQCPGLTHGAQEIHRLAGDVFKRLGVFSYKQYMPCLWLVFVGGTGTGKSSLFNALCGKPLSETGVERPKTCGPVAYVHRDCPIEESFPFPSIQTERRSSEDLHSRPAAGSPDHLLILEHDRQDWSHLVVVDTPDLDSVETENREIAEDLYLLSDAVVFLTSQEKYADEVPYQFLQRIIEERKPFFFLLNKAQEQLTVDEVIGALQGQGLSFTKDRVWLIPYAPSHPSRLIPEDSAFRDFVSVLSLALTADGIENLLETQHSSRAEDLRIRVGRLLEILEEESRADEKWLNQLEALYQRTSRDLINEQRERFTVESRVYLQTEIRRLFTKYDVLARPRRFVREVILTPFRFLGFCKERAQDTHENTLLEIRQKIDLAPVQAAIDKFNRSVLEELSPIDEGSPLFRGLRQPGVVLDDKEIKERIWEQQDRLTAWLQETFKKLSQGIPRGKKWGIYSTSVLWGILILSLETAVGGGFSVLDAALDSALAPFVTKGAVELFAYHEIQQTARELAKRYQEGLLSVVRHQRDRYEHCLQALMTPRETLEYIRALDSGIENRKP